MGKKAGILTFHSVMNYGSALQAVAMQNIMMELGLDVEIIDYRPDRPVERTDYMGKIRKMIKPQIWKKHLAYCVFAKRTHFAQKRQLRENKYEKFFSDYMRLSERCVNRKQLEEVSNKYDYLICGSDQIWNPNYLEGDYSYFFDFCNDAEKKIAYAPSVAVDYIRDSDREKFVSCVKAFKYVSVREKSSVRLLKDIADVDAQVVLDPTMLVNETSWEQYLTDMSGNLEPYILSYFLGSNTEYQDVVLELQNQTGYKILNIPHMHLWSAREYYDFGDERLVEAGPAEFLTLIKNAEYICTDSFHGSVFSILFEKPFFSFKRYSDRSVHSENSRIYTLLDMVGLKDRLIDTKKEMLDAYCQTIDYKSAKMRIADQKILSRTFLSSALHLE